MKNQSADNAQNGGRSGTKVTGLATRDSTATPPEGVASPSGSSQSNKRDKQG